MNSTEAIKALILDQIRGRSYAPGQRLETLRKLAKRTQTTPPTVLRAVTQLVDEGHLRNDPGKGYFVDSPLAEPSERRNLIGILAGMRQGQDPRGSYAGRRLQEIQPFLQHMALQENRALLTIGGRTDEGPHAPFLSPDKLKPFRLQAMVVVGIYDARYLRDLSNAQAGVVVLDLDAADLGIDSVFMDHLASGLVMVRELHRRGARRIAFLGGPVTPPRPNQGNGPGYDACVRERFDGWRLGMRACGLAFDDPSLMAIPDRRDNPSVRRALRTLLANGNRPDAIVSDRPREAYLTLQEMGGDVSGIPVAGWGSPEVWRSRGRQLELCSVGDYELAGPVLAEVLERRIERPSGPVQRRTFFPPVYDRTGRLISDR